MEDKVIEAMAKLFHDHCDIENCKRFVDNCGQCYTHQLLNLTYPNGQKMLAILDENQEVPACAFNTLPSDCYKDWRKVVLE